ncbi:XkdN-like protein [Brevibacillus borstelensis AK1]|uniref:XkdN-like protein n=1 Tax=Brevibacillus borstelensis AK1 TaxID=1300222 RepID=M8DML3_9BACL|nr:XkdN-like protein [Brevibacillus borstelensis]EMT54712.1 XkdN-like protein [Brevibacillus borstelensis AK1]
MAEFNLIQALLDAEFKPEKDVPMRRFGEEASFRVRALDEKERKRLVEKATYPVKGGEKFDEDKFSLLMIAHCCVEPNWNDPKLLAGLGVQTAEEAIGKRLLPGEIVKLVTAIHNLSGFGTDHDELKN